jgi:hypothetical protein
MATLANTFEGGSNGTTITAANSGGASGNAFNTVVVDSTLTYTTASAAHGSVAALASGTSDAYVAWTSGLAGTSATAYARTYFRVTSLPAANTNVLRMLSSSNGIMGTIRINSAGTLGMLYGAGSLGGTTSGTITLGAWFRVELRVTAGGSSNGTMVMRVFWTPDATTADQEITSSNVTTGAANPTRLRCGILSNSAEVYFDDLAFSDTDWIGPAGGGAGPSTGTLAAPLPPLAAQAAGSASSHAVASTTLPALTIQTTATAQAHGGVSATLPAIQAGATADATATGQGAATLPALTATTAGAAHASGALQAPLPALTAAAAGAAHADGTLPTTLPALTAAVEGDTIPEGGRLDTQLPPLTAAASGTARADASLAAPLPALDASAVGRARTDATLDTDLPALTITVAGARADGPAGALSAVLPALTSTATARAGAQAEMAATLPPLGISLNEEAPPLPDLAGTLRPAGRYEGVLTEAGQYGGTLAPAGTLTGALSAEDDRAGTLVTTGQLTGTI